MSTNQYQEMRNRQQAEVNAFPMFFAFNKQQFAEGMRKLGLSPSDTRQVSVSYTHLTLPTNSRV